MTSDLVKIWSYNEVTGYWVYVRDCYKEQVKDWLRIFKGDEPAKVFKACKTRPSKAPK